MLGTGAGGQRSNLGLLKHQARSHRSGRPSSQGLATTSPPTAARSLVSLAAPPLLNPNNGLFSSSNKVDALIMVALCFNRPRPAARSWWHGRGAGPSGLPFVPWKSRGRPWVRGPCQKKAWFRLWRAPTGWVQQAVPFYKVPMSSGAILALLRGLRKGCGSPNACRRRCPGFDASTDPGRGWHACIAPIEHKLL